MSNPEFAESPAPISPRADAISEIVALHAGIITSARIITCAGIIASARIITYAGIIASSRIIAYGCPSSRFCSIKNS